MRYSRRVEGVTKLDKTRNDDIRYSLKQETEWKCSSQKAGSMESEGRWNGRRKTSEVSVQRGGDW